MRYSRDDLLNVYRQQQEDGMVDARLDTVFVGPWQLGNGIRHDNEKIGAELCWEDEPVSVPFGLQEMSEDEKQVRRSCNAGIRVGQLTLTSYSRLLSIPH